MTQWQLIPWSKFKVLLFNIYEHRIDNAPELNGGINTNYCSMIEHLIIYFMDKLGRRDMAEEKIVELFINLYYFYDVWSRAKMFAWNLGIIPQKSSLEKEAKLKKQQEESHTKSSHSQEGTEEAPADVPATPSADLVNPDTIAPHALAGDEEALENDIYSQEYFLFCFSLLMTEKGNMVESDTGVTYYKYSDQEKLAARLVGVLRGGASDLNMWRIKAREFATILDQGGIDMDFIDVDILLNTLMNHYKKQKQALQLALKKEFLRKTGVVTANLKLTELEAILKTAEKAENMNTGSGVPDPCVGWSGEMSKLRAYVYSLTSSQSNEHAFGVNNLIAGLSRFGLDNPAPTISMRCALYGNSRSILKQLEIMQDKLKEEGKLLPLVASNYTEVGL